MESEKEYHFNASQLEEGLASLIELGVTRLIVADEAITGDRDVFFRFIGRAQKEAPDLFYKFYIKASVLDGAVCQSLSQLYCSLQLALDGKVLVGRKSFERKIELLNRSGLVFGFDLDFAQEEGDSARLFRDRLNYALSLYPNHIDFTCVEHELPSPTKTFSSKDIDLAADKAYACTLFYSAGRAVPWFLSVLKPLRIGGDIFFADFAEWLQCNNLGRKGSGPQKNGSKSSASQDAFDSIYQLSHKEIERMQLSFIKFKYQEKGLDYLLPVAQDLIRFNGAFGRLVGEDLESELDLVFHPEDLSSPYSQNLQTFADNVCMEQCRVRLCWVQDKEGNNFPDWYLV
ncbi:MAG: hypothetical protein J6K76_07865 [Spirochaetaceae bacterium]|nr:hypothetical protein [Spirochaetaceae bacterium]